MSPRTPPNAVGEGSVDWREQIAGAIRRVEDLPPGPAFAAARAVADLSRGRERLRPLAVTPTTSR